MFAGRSFFGKMFKPKNTHSAEYLRYLHHVLSKNQVITDKNRHLLVETLRSIAETLIWGDQNDSTVFDFFLEKNMLTYFLNVLNQKCGSYVCVQLLQTLNIMFENIRNETSLYYLLSNNHINSIIVHKFDFSDEEIMAYYISFLKTLSLKLNSQTIHFFFNESSNDFPLYIEAIKFFKHPESMVRIAVRTLTLNVYRVKEKSVLKFITDKTATPYFSNLVWFIKNHVLELDADLKSERELSYLVAEHLDHLHYLNDILILDIAELNSVLINELLNKLFVPLYVFSIATVPTKISPELDENSSDSNYIRISNALGLFLLSQVFLIMNVTELVEPLATIIINEKAADIYSLTSIKTNAQMENKEIIQKTDNTEIESNLEDHQIMSLNITDEEKEQMLSLETSSISRCSIFDVIVNNLTCYETDYLALFALCLEHAMSHNSEIRSQLLENILLPSADGYNTSFMDCLIEIITFSCQPGSRVRLVTLEVVISLIKRVCTYQGNCVLLDEHLAAIIGAKEESTSLLRNFYKQEDIFLDMFEDEYNRASKKKFNAEWLLMDSKLLQQPAGTPMTGIEFEKRLPCGDVERVRRAIRVFLMVRKLSMDLSGETDAKLPLSRDENIIQIGTALDLSNSDLITCTVLKDGTKTRRFLAMESDQLILVEPHSKLLGWGVTKLAGFLQDVEVSSDKDDSKSLCVNIRVTNSGAVYNAKFLFDDHIRCIAAKQKLIKGRTKARLKKLFQIENLLELPAHAHASAFNAISARHQSASSIIYGSCYRSPDFPSTSAMNFLSPILGGNSMEMRSMTPPITMTTLSSAPPSQSTPRASFAETSFDVADSRDLVTEK